MTNWIEIWVKDKNRCVGLFGLPQKNKKTPKTTHHSLGGLNNGNLCLTFQEGGEFTTKVPAR